MHWINILTNIFFLFLLASLTLTSEIISLLSEIHTLPYTEIYLMFFSEGPSIIIYLKIHLFQPHFLEFASSITQLKHFIHVLCLI